MSRVEQDFWAAELELPLAAFPDMVRQNRVWGVNFTRFDSSCQEYSSWSGAVGNVYDPISLGNMTVPQPAQ